MAPFLRNVLLDRDGTLIEERHYLCDPDGVALIPGAGPALARLVRAGVRLFGVTNQSGIGRGYYGLEQYLAVQARLNALLAAYGVVLEETAYCPHAPDMGCACRKPGTGMFTALAARHDLRPAETAVIGDAASDIAFGLALGSPLTILVRTGHGPRHIRELGLYDAADPIQLPTQHEPGWPHVLAKDLPTAVDHLLLTCDTPGSVP